MKKFFIRVTLFVLPVIVLCYPLDMLISKQLKRSHILAHEEYPVWNAVFDGKVNSDVVIYGSSRAWHHFDPAIIQDSLNVSAYNLGVDGQNFLLQHLRHKLLLKYNRKPKVIIYSLDAFTLQRQQDLYNHDQLLPYMLWNSEIKKTVRHFSGFNFWDYEIPLIRYYSARDVLKNTWNSTARSQNETPGRIRGYEGVVASWEGDIEQIRKELDDKGIRFDTLLINSFKKFLLECKAKNISVILVFSPEYFEIQKFIKNRNEPMELYRSLSKELSIPFFDFSDSDISHDKKFFYNCEHLNKTGAEQLTRQLCDTIKKYNLIR